jgi:hypothetical protein
MDLFIAPQVVAPQRRCGYCRNVGHDQRNCAAKMRDEMGYPHVHEANGLEVQRLRQINRVANVEVLRNRIVAHRPQDLLERPLPLPIPMPQRWEQQWVRFRTDLRTQLEKDLGVIATLPILREKAVEADECPICIEALGETGKTVLKCGHTLCQGCFLQQVLRATATKRKTDCACPICRVNYIM